MFHFLVDTCVWLDVANDHRQEPTLDCLESLVRDGKIKLLIPRIVLDEFCRNRDRIAKDSAKSLGSHLRLVKDAIERVGGSKRKTKRVLALLDDVGHKAPIIGGHAARALDRIERLMRDSVIFEIGPDPKLRAAQRALEKRAPFHRGKNSMADALIIEAYAERVRLAEPGIRFSFVTHNKNDFSVDQGNQQHPHSDFSEIFSRIKSLYFTDLPQALCRAEPRVRAELRLDEASLMAPRGLSEILNAMDLVLDQVWYNRHQNRRISVERGWVKLVETEAYPRPTGRRRETMLATVWELAKQAAMRVEKRYGKKNLGPWDDFEWGMINGKLSALRWVLGDDWDMLDT